MVLKNKIIKKISEERGWNWDVEKAREWFKHRNYISNYDRYFKLDKG